MLIELEYYEGKHTQKYNRFNHHDTPQMSIDQGLFILIKFY